MSHFIEEEHRQNRVTCCSGDQSLAGLAPLPMVPSVDFAANLRFVELATSGKDIHQWPCILFENTRQFRQQDRALREAINHGRLEAMESNLALSKFRLQCAHQSTQAYDNPRSSNPQVPTLAHQTPFVYLLGKVQSPSTRDVKMEANSQEKVAEGRPCRLLFAPNFTLHPFSEGFTSAMKLCKLPGFCEAIEEALALACTKNENVLIELASTDSPSPLLPLDLPIEGRVAANEPEFIETRIRFVPLIVQSHKRVVPWPAMMFHNWNKFRQQLLSCGLLKDVIHELKLFSIQRSLREQQSVDPPFAYLFGIPPLSSKVIPVGKRCAGLLHDQQPWWKACPYVDIPGFWHAHTELQFALQRLSVVATTTQPALASPETRRPKSPPGDRVPLMVGTASQPDIRMTTTTTKPKKRAAPHRRALEDITPKPQNRSRVPAPRASRRQSMPIITMTKSPLPPPNFGYLDIQYIPSFAEVWPLLENEGYSFERGQYCVAGSAGFNGVRGRDYFDSEQDFRRYLCVEGIRLSRGGSMRIQEVAKYEALKAWVSYHRVAKLLKGIHVGEQGPSLSSIPRLTAKAARVLKERLGFVYCQGSRWKVPGRRSRLNYFELCNELSRYGIPQDCDLSVLSFDELVTLELYIGCPEFRPLSFFQPRSSRVSQFQIGIAGACF